MHLHLLHRLLKAYLCVRQITKSNMSSCIPPLLKPGWIGHILTRWVRNTNNYITLTIQPLTNINILLQLNLKYNCQEWILLIGILLMSCHVFYPFKDVWSSFSRGVWLHVSTSFIYIDLSLLLYVLSSVLFR